MEIKYVVNYGLKDRFEWQSAILMKWKSREKRKWDRWIHLVNLRRVTIVKTDRLSFEYCHSKLEIELRRKWFSNKKRTRLVMINCDGKRLVVLWRFRFFMIFQKMHPRGIIIFLWFIGNGRFLFPFNRTKSDESGQILA